MMRNRDMPQIVVSGDPMQLGAVGADKDGSFVDAKLVKSLRPYVLVESFRQAENSHFLRILNRARLGCAEPEDLDWLVTNSSRDIGPDAPRLFCRVNQVADYNDCKLATLPAPIVVYTTTEQGDVPRRPSGTESALRIKMGARVMLTSNLTGHVGVHNGSCGTVAALDAQRAVVNFDNGRTLPIRPITTEYKKGKDDDVVGSRTEMPLILAWAVSIHRAQGATLDTMAVDLSRAFAKGHAYVALSRVREVEHAQILGNLSITTLNNVDKYALGWYNDCARRSAERAKRHKEREKKAERDAYEEQAEEAALNAAMDQFEATRAGGRVV
jgi:ATP-dependent DNA helicase PIF1